MNPPALSPGWFSVSTIAFPLQKQHTTSLRSNLCWYPKFTTNVFHSMLKWWFSLTWWESRDSSTGRKPWWKPIISSRWLGFCQPVRKTHGETELASLLFKVETLRVYQTLSDYPLTHLAFYISVMYQSRGSWILGKTWCHVEMSRSHGCQVVPNFVGKIIQLLETQLVRHGVMVGVP